MEDIFLRYLAAGTCKNALRQGDQRTGKNCPIFGKVAQTKAKLKNT
jgi:hypothetical protein